MNWFKTLAFALYSYLFCVCSSIFNLLMICQTFGDHFAFAFIQLCVMNRKKRENRMLTWKPKSMIHLPSSIEVAHIWIRFDSSPFFSWWLKQIMRRYRFDTILDVVASFTVKCRVFHESRILPIGWFIICVPWGIRTFAFQSKMCRWEYFVRFPDFRQNDFDSRKLHDKVLKKRRLSGFSIWLFIWEIKTTYHFSQQQEDPFMFDIFHVQNDVDTLICLFLSDFFHFQHFSWIQFVLWRWLLQKLYFERWSFVGSIKWKWKEDESWFQIACWIVLVSRETYTIISIFLCGMTQSFIGSPVVVGNQISTVPGTLFKCIHPGFSCQIVSNFSYLIAWKRPTKPSDWIITFCISARDIRITGFTDFMGSEKIVRFTAHPFRRFNIWCISLNVGIVFLPKIFVNEWITSFVTLITPSNTFENANGFIIISISGKWSQRKYEHIMFIIRICIE